MDLLADGDPQVEYDDYGGDYNLESAYNLDTAPSVSPQHTDHPTTTDDTDPSEHGNGDLKPGGGYSTSLMMSQSFSHVPRIPSDSIQHQHHDQQQAISPSSRSITKQLSSNPSTASAASPSLSQSSTIVSTSLPSAEKEKEDDQDLAQALEKIRIAFGNDADTAVSIFPWMQHHDLTGLQQQQQQQQQQQLTPGSSQQLVLGGSGSTRQFVTGTQEVADGGLSCGDGMKQLYISSPKSESEAKVLGAKEAREIEKAKEKEQEHAQEREYEQEKEKAKGKGKGNVDEGSNEIVKGDDKLHIEETKGESNSNDNVTGHDNNNNISNNKLSNIKANSLYTGKFASDGPLLSLDELIMVVGELLKNGKENASLPHIRSAMERYNAPAREWTKYVYWDSNCKYTRNLVATDGKNYSLMVLCWNSEKESPIHNHPSCECFVRLLDGYLTEYRYDWPSGLGGEMEELICTSRIECGPGDVTLMNDDMGLHKLANMSGSGAVTLHLYFPPYRSCKMFLDGTAKETTGYMCYHTEGGNLIPK